MANSSGAARAPKEFLGGDRGDSPEGRRLYEARFSIAHLMCRFMLQSGNGDSAGEGTVCPDVVSRSTSLLTPFRESASPPCREEGGAGRRVLAGDSSNETGDRS